MIGDVGADRIEVTLRVRDRGEETEQAVTLTGADFEAALATLRATDIVRVDPAEVTDGGSVTSVTLIDAAGTERSGPPTNPRDWEALAATVRERAER